MMNKKQSFALHRIRIRTSKRLQCNWENRDIRSRGKIIRDEPKLSPGVRV